MSTLIIYDISSFILGMSFIEIKLTVNNIKEIIAMKLIFYIYKPILT